MCKTNRFLYVCLLALSLWLSPLVCGATPKMYSVSEEQLTEIETLSNELMNDNERLENLLKNSNEDLNVALIALMNSQKIQKELKAELLKAKLEMMKAEESLKTAEKELNDYKKYVEKLEKNQQKKHDVKLGVAYVYDTPYGVLSYRNRDIEYSVMYGDKNKLGFEISYTLLAW